jgi:hypothetical protein
MSLLLEEYTSHYGSMGSAGDVHRGGRPVSLAGGSGGPGEPSATIGVFQRDDACDHTGKDRTRELAGPAGLDSMRPATVLALGLALQWP